MATATQINNIDFGIAFTINNGEVEQHLDIDTPEVTLEDRNLYFDDRDPSDSEWTALKGLSNQDRYDGPILHESEIMSDGIVELMEAQGGTFVLVFVEVVNDDPEDDDPFPAGWMILRKA